MKVRVPKEELEDVRALEQKFQAKFLQAELLEKEAIVGLRARKAWRSLRNFSKGSGERHRRRNRKAEVRGSAKFRKGGA